MKKLGFLTIFIFISAVIAAQIVIPINKRRVESYGIWQYDNLVIDTMMTRLEARFIATDTASIWGDYSEKLIIDGTIYECIYEDLPLSPFDTTFYAGDTLHYSEIFLPIFDGQNSGKELSYIGGDSIDFIITLPIIESDLDSIKLQKILFENASIKYNEGDYVASSRILRLAAEIRSSTNTSELIDLAHSIYSNIRPLNLNAKRIVVNDLYKIATMTHDSCIFHDRKYSDIILSALKQSDIIDNQLDFSYTDSLCYKNQKWAEAVTVLDYYLKENIFEGNDEIRIYEKQLNYLTNCEEHELALSKVKELKEVISAYRGVSHPSYANTLLSESKILNNLDSIENAIFCCEKALSVFKESDVHIVGRMDNLPFEEYCHYLLSNYYSKNQNDSIALFHNNKAERIHQQCNDDSDISLVEILTQKGSIFRDMGRYEDMLDTFNIVLQIIEDNNGDANPNYKCELLKYISGVLIYLERYEDAKSFTQLEYELAKINKNHDILYDALEKLNYIAVNRNDKLDVSFTLNQIKEIYDRGITGWDEYSTVCNRVIDYYIDVKDLETANAILEDLENLISDYKSEEYAYLQNVKAKIFFNSGEIAKAIELQEKEMQRRLPIFGRVSSKYANCLNNLSVYYENIGLLDKAIEYGEQSYFLRDSLLEEYDPIFHHSLNNLSNLYRNKGDYSKSKQLLERYLKISEDPENGITRDKGWIMQSLGLLFLDLDSLKLANIYLQEGLNLIKNAYTENSMEYARGLSNYGDYYYKIDDYENAFQLEKKSLEIFKNYVSEDSKYYLSKLGYCMFYAFLIDDWEWIESKFDLFNNYMIDISYANLMNINNNYMEDYWETQKKWFFDWLPYYAYSIANSNNIVCQAYNGQLYAKALLLNVKNHTYNNGKRIFDMSLSKNDITEDKVENEYKEKTRTIIDWRKVQSSLPSGSIAIEFCKFEHKDSTQYIALVVEAESEYPTVVDLFVEEKVLSITPQDYYLEKELSELIWQPLDSILSKSKQVFFSPTGILNTIAIESLPDYNGNGYISDRIKFHRLTSTREIYNQDWRNNNQFASAFGDIDYSIVNESDFDDSLNKKLYNISRGSMCPLPSTKKEIESIKESLEESKYEVNLYIGANASETVFKGLCDENPNYIHVATHGFYWHDTEELDKHQRRLVERYNKNSISKEEIALCRSGLLFAGANKTLLGRNESRTLTDDGILTAKEISNLNLSDVEMVVLSACQTGLGEISDDGVFGLQRGFKIAGVKSIVMSLWEVDDEATQILMTEFYRNLAKGNSKEQSLRIAQKRVRETPGFEDPEYWAAFILLDGLN